MIESGGGTHNRFKNYDRLSWYCDPGGVSWEKLNLVSFASAV